MAFYIHTALSSHPLYLVLILKVTSSDDIRRSVSPFHKEEDEALKEFSDPSGVTQF